MYRRAALQWMEAQLPALRAGGVSYEVEGVGLREGTLTLKVRIRGIRGRATLTPGGRLTLWAQRLGEERSLMESAEELDGPEEVAEALSVFVDALTLLNPSGGCLSVGC